LPIDRINLGMAILLCKMIQSGFQDSGFDPTKAYAQRFLPDKEAHLPIGFGRLPLLPLLLHGQKQLEGTPLSSLALHFDSSLVGLDDLFAVE
jgi:hypothetical protein